MKIKYIRGNKQLLSCLKGVTKFASLPLVKPAITDYFYHLEAAESCENNIYQSWYDELVSSYLHIVTLLK